MKIVVMGGSFNPPTLAHKILMKEAIAAIDADLGLFVPSSNAYVARKMSKKKQNNQLYSETERLEMLELITKEVKKSKVSTCEYGDDGKGHTYNTLSKIQKEYPEADIFFLCGADNLNIIYKWRAANKLISEFNFLVVKRENENPMSIIESVPLLNGLKSHFTIILQPNEIDNISSTKVRNMINQNALDELKTMCPPEVVDYLQAKRLI